MLLLFALILIMCIVITKDNVIDSVVYYQITDSKLYIYRVENPLLRLKI